jgi:hypothetical protein
MKNGKALNNKIIKKQITNSSSNISNEISTTKKKERRKNPYSMING